MQVISQAQGRNYGVRDISNLCRDNFGAGLDYRKTIGSILCTNATETVRIIIHNPASPQMKQFVEQKNRELFEQKNTVPKELNSYNFGNLLDYAKIGSKHQTLLNSLKYCRTETCD
jgi:hypothetical protein